jgi:hypothetical protein
MYPVVLIPFCFAGLAILLVVAGAALDKRGAGLTVVKFCAFGAFVCCYGFCAFIAFGILAGLFHMRVWLAIVVAVPLGLPVLYLLGKAGE